jgi:cyanophycinase
MRRLLLLCLGLILHICNVTIAQKFPAGNLVIVGGGLEDNNISVYNQMIELAGGTDKAIFAVIPSASGVAVQSFESFKKTLISYGVNPVNIHLIPIAMVDDDSTTDVNESTWNKNGEDIKLANLVKKCSGVWFTGGDQTRTTKTLFRSDGTKTPVLDAVWEVYNRGGVIGGSSAGAAIMSDPMIGGGNSLAALTKGVITDYTGDDFQESEGVWVTRGLGFFSIGMVDQHFGERSRIGRLVVALLHEKEKFHLGFGIDENTALIYEGSKNQLSVEGESGVTLVDIHNISHTTVKGLPDIEHILISRIERGDNYDIATGIIYPAPGKTPTSGKEYYNNNDPGQAGMLSGYSENFRDLISVNLMDNKGADTVKNLSFTGDTAGFLVTIYKTKESEGFYTDKPDGNDHYTIIKVAMDIEPVVVEIERLKD